MRSASAGLCSAAALAGAGDSASTTSPPSRCAYRDSFVPGCRGSTFASGGSRCINFCNADCTSSSTSKRCMRSARPRSSPGVCGPRSSSTQRTAISGRVKLNTSCNLCSYLVTRLSAPRAGPARRCCCRPSSASRTASSFNCITGSRFVFWLQAFTSAFSDRG